MRVFLITGHTYPVGTAMANRMRSYLEAMARQGVDTNVLIYRSSEDPTNVQNERSGELNGVKYQSSAISHVKSTNKILTKISYFHSYFNCLKILKREEKKKHIDIVFQASARSSIIPFVYFYTRWSKSKFVIENNEFPWFILNKKKKIRNVLDKFLYEKIYYPMFDGFLLMTTSLMKYHQHYKKKKAKLILLPMTVDMNRFMLNCRRKNHITYIGNNSYFKDGVNYLLDAFIKIANEIPDWKLVLIGPTGNDNTITGKIKEAGIGSRVELMGFVHRDSVPKMLCESKILVLARPDNKQAEGGFPTKLGEYLATGNLVVVTSVGDIPKYLKNGESAIIVKPNNVDDLAFNLRYAIKNDQSTTEIGKNGKKACESIFDADKQAKNMITFFKTLTS